TICRMLSNEKYIGNILYNQTSSKLGTKNARNPPTEWVRVEHAFDQIIEPAIFESARQIIAQRRIEKAPNERWANAEMLSKLACLFSEKGYLTTTAINDAEALPHSTLYRKRFGSLKRAYRLVGCQQEKNFQYFDGRRSV